MKKVLIISHVFFPENSPRSFRATELAKELARQGHQVKVIAEELPRTLEYCNEHGIDFKDIGKITWKAPKVKGSGIIRLFWRLVVRLSGLLFEYPLIQLIPMLKKALKDEKDYDLLISIAVPYPIHWGVASVRTDKHKIAKTWVADCGDPYMGQENDTFKPPFYFAYLEKKFCRKADFITVPTENAIMGYYKEFHSKIRVISQGFRFEDVEVYKGDLKKSKLVFGYGGMFIPGRRDPSEFLNYLNSLDKDLDFEFHIYTITPQFVAPFIAESHNNRIVLKPLLPRKDLLFEMSKMDFVVNFENVGKAQTPSKLIDFVIIDKPILSVKFGNLKTAIVDEFLNKNYTHQLKINNPQQYRIENVADKFLGLIS